MATPLVHLRTGWDLVRCRPDFVTYRTERTRNPDRVTCKRCLAAMKRDLTTKKTLCDHDFETLPDGTRRCFKCDLDACGTLACTACIPLHAPGNPPSCVDLQAKPPTTPGSGS